MKPYLDHFLIFVLCILFVFLAVPLRAADISTHSFSGCTFPDTAQSAGYTATFGEDSDYSSGVSTPSYTIYNPAGISSVTVDNRTGLMWLTNPNTDAGLGASKTWGNAVTACLNLNYAGYTDWRLPNAKELLSLLVYSQAEVIDHRYFPGLGSNGYWASTTCAAATSEAWVVSFGSGIAGHYGNTVSYYTTCVRGGP